MVVVRELPLVGRPIRMDAELAELGENTLGKVREAILSGNRQLALDLVDYLYWEDKGLHDTYTDWTFADLTWIARNYGEEEIPKALRFVRETLGRSPYLTKRAKATTMEKVILHCEGMRAHHGGPKEAGDLRVWEEADRFVLEFDPCGSGGRMARGPLNQTGSRVEPPYNLGRTSKPYPWSWGKANVPYYCIHCCLWMEIMAIENMGYQMHVTDCPVEDFQKPCHWYFYKSPDLIPEQYFERVGFKKDPSKFKV